MPMLSFLTIN